MVYTGFVGFRVQGLRFRVLGLELVFLGLASRIQGLGYGVLGTIKIYGSGCGVRLRV